MSFKAGSAAPVPVGVRADLVSGAQGAILGFILIFVGLKMVWLNEAFGGKFPIAWSLGIIAVLLAASIGLSLLFPPREEREG